MVTRGFRDANVLVVNVFISVLGLGTEDADRRYGATDDNDNGWFTEWVVYRPFVCRRRVEEG